MLSLRHRFFWAWALCCGCFLPLVLTGAIGFSLGMGVPDTDQQQMILLYAALPLIALCLTGQMLLHRFVYQQSAKLLPLLLTFPLWYGLAWFGTALLAGNPQERGLPMLNEYTVAPQTWYLAFVGSWIICNVFGGFVYLALTGLSLPTRQVQAGNS